MMTNGITSLKPYLICRSGIRSCGFPLDHVAETMRGLPVEAFPDMPSFMAGLSIIRGTTVPVVNLAMLLGDMSNINITRFVSLKLGNRMVAFAVDSVTGVGQFAIDETTHLPPLLSEVNSSVVSLIGIRDADLFSVLEASRIIPELVWKDLDARGLVS